MQLTSPGEIREIKRAKANRDELVERLARYLPDDGVLEAAPGLFLSRCSSPTGPIYGDLQPSLCIVAQGSKKMLLGKENFRYDASKYLLISAGLPLVAHVIEASPERPYFGVRIVLDPAVITEVLLQAGLVVSAQDGSMRALAVSQLDTNLLDVVVRLVRLIDAPEDGKVLTSLAIREIVYRLAHGEQADRLRQLAAIDGHAHRIVKAIELIRKAYNKPLRIADLARNIGMSVSAFHEHFKTVTAMSPAIPEAPSNAGGTTTPPGWRG